MAARGRVLGIDPGLTYIGIAVSDSRGRLALPHGVINAGEGDIMRLLSLIKELNCTAVVVGMPQELNSSSREVVNKAREIGRGLSEAGLKVHYFDERFTTRITRRAGRAKKRRDDEAAALMLQTFLDRKASQHESRP